LLCGCTIPYKGIGREFWRNQIGSGPLGFLANPQLSTDLVCLYQLPFELASHAIQHDELSRFYVGLKSQLFPLSLAIKGLGSCNFVGCQLIINAPHRIFSGVFNVNIVQCRLLMFDQFDSERIPNDQRYNVNLIRYNISSKIYHLLAS